MRPVPSPDMTTTAWILAVLATYRITLLVVADEITRPPRDWLLRRLGPEHKVSYLITCPWCTALWIAYPVVASGLEWSRTWWWQLAAGGLAVAGAVGFLSRYASPE